MPDPKPPEGYESWLDAILTEGGGVFSGATNNFNASRSSARGNTSVSSIHAWSRTALAASVSTSHAICEPG